MRAQDNKNNIVQQTDPTTIPAIAPPESPDDEDGTTGVLQLVLQSTSESPELKRYYVLLLKKEIKYYVAKFIEIINRQRKNERPYKRR